MTSATRADWKTETREGQAERVEAERAYQGFARLDFAPLFSRNLRSTERWKGLPSVAHAPWRFSPLIAPWEFNMDIGTIPRNVKSRETIHEIAFKIIDIDIT